MMTAEPPNESAGRREAVLRRLRSWSRDWAATPLGPVEGWPSALCVAVQTLMAAPIPMQLFWGPDLLCVYNEAMTPSLAEKHPAAMGQPAREVWREAWATVGPQMEHVWRTGEAIFFKNTLVPVLQNGTLEDRYWTYSYSPVLDERGELVGVLDVAQDTTEEELVSSRAQLRLAMDAAALASWYYDPARNVVGGDTRMGQLFGLAVPEGPAELWLSAVMEEDRPRVGQEFAAAIAGAPYDTEYRVCVRGRVCWLRAKAKIVRLTGTSTRMVGICEDISERKQAESSLHETVARLALAQQVGNIAAWDWDLQTGELTWDAGSTRVYGRPNEELQSLEVVGRYIHKDDEPAVLESVRAAMEGSAEFNAEFRVCWPDGSHHWLIGKGRTVFDEEGKAVRINGVNIDITERRTAELALRQNEKLAAVGQLASTIAHEINNPLEAVTNLLYLSQESASDPEAVTKYLASAEVQLRRMAAISNQTLRFHKQQSGPTEITCQDLFTNALLIFQGRLENAGIRVEKRKRAERSVRCLEGEIRQVMNNLIGNAIDAMKQGGRLLVRSAEGVDWPTGRRGLVLTVADTGCGMDESTRRHLFEPFFTTKGINGTGLGLWVSREIVQRHEGRLLVRSSTRDGSSGTVFRLFLPY